MKINSIQLEELPSGEAVLRCPQCRATWHSPRASGWFPCNCIQFLWGTSELGDAILGFPGKFDHTEFENAYRQQHWLVYQDDEIIEGDLGPPDPRVLGRLQVAGVDEALFFPKVPGADSQGTSGICVGIKYARRGSNRRKRSAICGSQAGTCTSPTRPAKAPDWAADFLGRRFDIESAESAGWVDQYSDRRHFGVPAGQGIWLFKLGLYSGSPRCAIGKVWWRFLLVKISSDGRIRKIYTRVDEVFPDGHGEFCTYDLLPHDITEALEALEAVAQEGTPVATVN